MTQPPLTQPADPVPARPRRLLRSSSDRVLGGVCGGLGEYFAVDPILFRILTVVLALVGGVSFIAYPILWIFVPRDDGTGNPEPLPIWRLFGGRSDTPPSAGRMFAVAAGVVAALVLAALLARMEPWRDQVILDALGTLGSAARPLGMLAAALDRMHEADVHFAHALQVHERMRAPSLHARTKLDWGLALQRAGRPEDAARAGALLEQAAQAMRDLALPAVERRARDAAAAAVR